MVLSPCLVTMSADVIDGAPPSPVHAHDVPVPSDDGGTQEMWDEPSDDVPLPSDDVPVPSENDREAEPECHFVCEGPTCRFCGSDSSDTFWHTDPQLRCPVCWNNDCGGLLCPCTHHGEKDISEKGMTGTWRLAIGDLREGRDLYVEFGQ